MMHTVNMNQLFARAPVQRRTACRASVRAMAKASPPTVSDTKNKFITSYSRPIPAIYGNIINELIVQQHIWRYNTAYQYDEVFALGVVSIFEQLMDGYDTTEREKIFAAYITALGENPEQYKRDAAAMEAAAAQLSGAGAASLMPGSDGVLGATTAKIASRIKEGKFFYTRFFAIGLFRLLELVGTKDPEALKSLVSAIGTRQDLVTKDLTLYKSILNRLQGAKELMKDFLERERRKSAEREEAKKEKAEKEAKAAQV